MRERIKDDNDDIDDAFGKIDIHLMRCTISLKRDLTDIYLD